MLTKEEREDIKDTGLSFRKALEKAIDEIDNDEDDMELSFFLMDLAHFMRKYGGKNEGTSI